MDRPGTLRRVAHYLFNFSTRGREDAAALLRAKMWAIGEAERHDNALVQGDLILVYLAREREFIGRAKVASPAHDWTTSEAEAYPGDSPSGVLLSHVEEWDPAVPMDSVVQRIDPTASNPMVQRTPHAASRWASLDYR